MKRRKKNLAKNNLRVAFIFCVLLTLLILISLIFKLFFLIQRSSFDGEHRFTIVVSDTLGKNEVISFAPQTQTISVLRFPKSANLKILPIPIDGTVFFKKDKELKIQSKLKTMLLHYNNLSTNLTIIDIARLSLFARTVFPSSITELEFPTPKGEEATLDALVIDKISFQLFSDPTILEEKVSIAIINGTGQLGLGNRLARLITNMGGNVVTVSTADSVVNTSEIFYSNGRTYTLKRLNKVLGFKTVIAKKQGITEMTIIIGKDSLGSLTF